MTVLVLPRHGEYGAEIHRLRETAPQEKPHRVSTLTIGGVVVVGALSKSGGGGHCTTGSSIWTRKTWCSNTHNSKVISLKVSRLCHFIQYDITFYHMFLCLWSEISLYHKLIYDIAQGSILIGLDVAVCL